MKTNELAVAFSGAALVISCAGFLLAWLTYRRAGADVQIAVEGYATHDRRV